MHTSSTKDTISITDTKDTIKTLPQTIRLCLALQPKISKLRNHYYKWLSRNHYYKWLSIPFLAALYKITKSLSQESYVPNPNTLFEFLTY